MQKNFDEKVKCFFQNKKNTAITILTIFVLLFAGMYFNEKDKKVVSTSTVKVSEAENTHEELTNLSKSLKETNEKVTSLQNEVNTLTEEKEKLITQLYETDSTEELQKTIDEKNQYILNLEAQVGTLTAEKAQAEAQNGILQEQLSNAQKSSSTTKKTSSNNAGSSVDTSATVYITNTGSKYHTANCSYLRSSKIAISKNSAISQGYTACSRYNP